MTIHMNDNAEFNRTDLFRLNISLHNKLKCNSYTTHSYQYTREPYTLSFPFAPLLSIYKSIHRGKD